MTRACNTCGGSGAPPGPDQLRCPVCFGTGCQDVSPVHLRDPFTNAIRCGESYPGRASVLPRGVTCPACIRAQVARNGAWELERNPSWRQYLEQEETKS
jgi:DnaJ-class molecular chaperone